MKRVGNLLERIASIDNLHEAFLRAVRGKAAKQEVLTFRQNLDGRLLTMQRQLLDGTFRFGRYHFFTVYDPKRRTICAASFEERVAFHAMMRVCHPVFDDYQVYDSYASRQGKGTYAALDRALQYARRYRWFAKLDVRKYFDSIDHEVLLSQLCRLFKDARLLLMFRHLVDSYHTDAGCGLPIGNLTSQYFANHYLSPADYYAKEELRVAGLVRYMDDVLLFGDDKDVLLQQVDSWRSHVAATLHLQLHDAVVNRCRHGIPFLGYVVHPEGLRLNGRSRRRFRTKMRELDEAVETAMMSQEEYAMRATCLHAFVRKAQSDAFLRSVATEKRTRP